MILTIFGRFYYIFCHIMIDEILKSFRYQKGADRDRPAPFVCPFALRIGYLTSRSTAYAVPG